MTRDEIRDVVLEIIEDINDEEDLTWRLPWTDVGDGTGLYFAPPPQSGGDETNPRALPPDERLDFIVPGGEDIPPFEIRSGLRT